MVYTLQAGIRDREYNSYTAVQAGSLAAQAVFIASGLTAGLAVSGTVLATQWTGVGSVMISGTLPYHAAPGSVLLCGYSGTNIIALRCTSAGFLIMASGL